MSDNKTIRIPAKVGDSKEKFINVKLEQDFEKIEVLSLTLKQSQIYRSFNADYGVVVGRVQSSGVGLPNCKVSVFIPISSDDQLNPTLLSIYPFLKPSDKDSNGKRYNLLNKLKRLNPFSGFKENNYGIGYKPKTPIGSIPDKVELLCNDSWIEVYEKYYKYTTVTNSSGDYMIFGVPTGNQPLHMDCDITDIGKYSTSIPLLTQVGGLPSDSFNNDGTQLLKTNDLSSIPTLQSQDATVNVIPFWGDKTNYQIGITRHDFNIITKIIPSFTLMGAGITQGENSYWGNRIVFQANMGLKNLCIQGGDCDSFQLDNSPGIRIRMCFGFNLNFLKKSIASGQIGIPDSASSACANGQTFSFKLCISIIVSNIIPFFNVRSFIFDRCQMNGGDFEQEPISIKWLGRTSSCDELSSPDIIDDFTSLMNLDDCRVLPINEQIFYYPNTVLDSDITAQNVDITADIKTLTTNQYAKVNSDDGTFLYQIPCNRTKVITDEYGNEIPTNDNSLGLYTEFYGYTIFSMGNNDGSDIKSSGGKVNVNRTRIKVPQCVDYNEDSWVKSAYKFTINEIYSVAQYFDTEQYSTDTNFINSSDDTISKIAGLILDVNTLNQTDDNLYGIDLEMLNNSTISLFSGAKISNIFTKNWLNGILFFYQVAVKTKSGKRQDKGCDFFIGTDVRSRTNNEPLGSNKTDNKFILNGYHHQTNFIQIDKDDLIYNMLPTTRRGFLISNDPYQDYMNNNLTTNKYFYKGIFQNSDFLANFLNKDTI
jgi:hypothetical protein